MNERVKVFYKNGDSEDVKIVYACNDPKKDDEVIFKLHGHFYSYFRNSSNFYVSDKRIFERDDIRNAKRPEFDFMSLPYGCCSWEYFVEQDDDIEYIWSKPNRMTEDGSAYKIPYTPTISERILRRQKFISMN